MKLPKIPVSKITDKDLEKAKQLNILRARIKFQTFPAATKLWVAIKTGLPILFVQNNWEEITK